MDPPAYCPFWGRSKTGHAVRSVIYIFNYLNAKLFSPFPGESAGGASAAAHLFAPDSHALFGRLIANSGAIVNNWATKPKAIIRDISFKLARRLNCTDQKVN
jgi:hypothetical protein